MKTGKNIWEVFYNEPNLHKMRKQRFDNIGIISGKLLDDLCITFYRNIVQQIRRKD